MSWRGARPGARSRRDRSPRRACLGARRAERGPCFGRGRATTHMRASSARAQGCCGRGWRDCATATRPPDPRQPPRADRRVRTGDRGRRRRARPQLRASAGGRPHRQRLDAAVRALRHDDTQFAATSTQAEKLYAFVAAGAREANGEIGGRGAVSGRRRSALSTGARDRRLSDCLSPGSPGGAISLPVGRVTNCAAGGSPRTTSRASCESFRGLWPTVTSSFHYATSTASAGRPSRWTRSVTLSSYER